MKVTVGAYPKVDTIESLNWVSYVAETDRDDATHRVDTDLTMVRKDYEIHDLENLGVEVTGFSAVPEHGSRVYIR